ncbi:MAG: signal peptidase II [Planctomycetota bacterium]
MHDQRPRRLPFQPLGRSGLSTPWFFATALGITALDLVSKAWAWGIVEADGRYLRVLPEEPMRRLVPVIDGFFFIAREENTGTLWGLFQDYTLPLTLLRIGMVLFLVGFAASLLRERRLAVFGLGLVLGGALGNLHDNLFALDGVKNVGAVRDFLDFYLPLPWLDRPYHYPTFNVADASILIGAVLLFFGLGERKPAAAGDQAGTEAG